MFRELSALEGHCRDNRATDPFRSGPNRPDRRLVINARTFDDSDKDRVRLRLAVTAVTDMRAEALLKDDLVRDKAILMQNAHHRVMSIAAVQKQLSTSTVGKVELRTYFTQLCESLGASMIADTDRLSIAVMADDSAVDPDVSISLGLIVTELVINALKHAFPDQSKGRIEIDYRSADRDWTLSVSDNGIGLPMGSDAPKAGLGTGIVEALARNLRGTIEVSDAGPGATVTIRHRATADADAPLPAAEQEPIARRNVCPRGRRSSDVETTRVNYV